MKLVVWKHNLATTFYTKSPDPPKHGVLAWCIWKTNQKFFKNVSEVSLWIFKFQKFLGQSKKLKSTCYSPWTPFLFNFFQTFFSSILIHKFTNRTTVCTKFVTKKKFAKNIKLDEFSNLSFSRFLHFYTEKSVE